MVRLEIENEDIRGFATCVVCKKSKEISIPYKIKSKNIYWNDANLVKHIKHDIAEYKIKQPTVFGPKEIIPNFHLVSSTNIAENHVELNSGNDIETVQIGN